MDVRTVRSADGTPIAYSVSGDGPPLLVVEGALSDRGTTAALLPYLAPHFTVYAVDRRGRGGSGDAPRYAVDRELDDLAAVLAAVLATAAGPAFVYGHSSGAILALEAALRGLPVAGLAVYEPPYRDGVQPTDPDRIAALVRAGDRDAAVETFLREGPGMSGAEIDRLRASPMWTAWLALAHTAPYDARLGGGPPPVDRLARLRTPTTVLAGDAGPAWIRHSAQAVAAALPDARLRILPGQGHRPAPEPLAAALVEVFQTEEVAHRGRA